MRQVPLFDDDGRELAEPLKIEKLTEVMKWRLIIGECVLDLSFNDMIALTQPDSSAKFESATLSVRYDAREDSYYFHYGPPKDRIHAWCDSFDFERAFDRQAVV